MASLKQMTQTALIESVLDHIVSHYAPERMEDMQKDVVLSEIFSQFFDPTEKVVKKKVASKKKASKKAEVSPKVSLEDRQEAGVDESKCLCRIWKNGLDNVQCSRNKKEGDFCGAHIKKGAANGEWWLGLVTEDRPEEPMGPPGSKKGPSRHYWTNQDQPVKKSRKKSEPVEEEVEELVVTSAEEVKISEVVEEVKISEVVEEVKISEVVAKVIEEIVDSVEDSVEELVEVGAGVGEILPTIVRTESNASTASIHSGDMEQDTTEYGNDEIPFDVDSLSEEESEEESEDEEESEEYRKKVESRNVAEWMKAN